MRITAWIATGITLAVFGSTANATTLAGKGTGTPQRKGITDIAAGSHASAASLRVAPRMHAKTLSDGIYMSGQFGYLFSGDNANAVLDRINNTSTGDSGTLRLSLWAATDPPARGD